MSTPARPNVIKGVVRDARGRPVSQARVYFVGGPDPLPEIAALTDESGAFTLSAPSPGPYSIGIAGEGFSSTEVKTEAGRSALEIKLPNK